MNYNDVMETLNAKQRAVAAEALKKAESESEMWAVVYAVLDCLQDHIDKLFKKEEGGKTQRR